MLFFHARMNMHLFAIDSAQAFLCAIPIQKMGDYGSQQHSTPCSTKQYLFPY